MVEEANLYIGGCADGTWRVMPSEKPIVSFQKIGKMPSLSHEPLKMKATDSVPVEIEHYKIVEFHAPERIYRVRALESMRHADVFEALLKNYRPRV